jgi:hypothetical protein
VEKFKKIQRNEVKQWIQLFVVSHRKYNNSCLKKHNSTWLCLYFAYTLNREGSTVRITNGIKWFTKLIVFHIFLLSDFSISFLSFQVITQGGVTYRNEPWHRECFTCTHCVKSLAGQRFTSRDDKPYCAECFGELFSKRCTACAKPITGKIFNRFLIVLDLELLILNSSTSFKLSTCKNVHYIS